MTKWVTKKLGDLGKLVSGLTYSPNNVVDEGVLVLRSSNIHNDNICLEDNVYVNVTEYNPVQDGDVLICVRNGSRALIGKTARINKEIDGCAFGAFMAIYRSEYNDFLYHFFKSESFFSQVSRNIGATINSINGSDLKNMEVFFPVKDDSTPDLTEQKRIASILSSADNVIATSEALIEKYKSIKQGMLTDLLTPKKGWKKVKLGECCEVNPHNTTNLPERFFYIDLESVESGKLIKNQFINKKEAPSRAQRLVLHNDILYQTVRPYQKNNYIFKGNNNQYVASTGYALLRVKNNVDADFIYHMVHTHEFVSEVLGLCTGTSYPAITPSLLNKIEITVPYKNGQLDLSEQERISNILSSIDAKIVAEEKVVEKYKGVKKGLMERMMGSEKN